MKIRRLFSVFNPLDMTAGFWLQAAALAVCAIPVHGQPLTPTTTTPRTAQWYADRDDVRNDVVKLCRDYPGEARTNGDCAAAWQGNIIAAEREARRNAGDLTPPTSPRYWVRRPLERAEYLAMCGRLSPEQRSRLFCKAAGHAG